MRILFVENHDSFSWNVIELLPVPREDVRLVSGATALRLLDGADALVIGPGPMDPPRAGLIDLVQVAAERRLPTLGVCLGHQALGLAFGARLEQTTPAHGKRAVISFEGSRLFPSVAGRLDVMRYHSLSLVEVPPPLRVVARLQDGTVMAIEHDSLPMAGVQFHPDSWGTPRGRAVIEAFFRAAEIHAPRTDHPAIARRATRGGPASHERRSGALEASEERRSSEAVVDALTLSSLRSLDDFALLSPGYSDDGRWTLLTELQMGGKDLVVCEAESRTPRWLGGTRRSIALELDVPAARLEPHLEEEGFTAAVAEVREAVARGDVYQVNLTRRALLGETDPAALLAAVCRRGIPRFAAWVKVNGVGEFVAASPELLVELRGRTVRVEPMKGTAAKGRRAWLEASAKDAAELGMITDLLRDDLQPLCVPHSVRVIDPRRFIELPYVVQTVSVVEGQLEEQVTADDVLRRVHPGGSVTGAPREAALAVIERLESTPRRFYCGALGLQSPEGLRTALLIRTAWREPSGWWWGVGGGITWDSVPEKELEELHLKLGALK